MYKTTPDVIFVFEFRAHFGGGQTTVLEKTLESLFWLWHDLRFLGLCEEEGVPNKYLQDMACMRRKRPQENSKRNTRTE